MFLNIPQFFIIFYKIIIGGLTLNEKYGYIKYRIYFVFLPFKIKSNLKNDCSEYQKPGLLLQRRPYLE